MKVAILAGGRGSRLEEETSVKPKPMVEIGGKPIIWHIMMHYAQFGFTDFLIALGYKGELLKKYFVDYCALNGSLKVDMGTGEVTQVDGQSLDWQIGLIDTGQSTQTGGRIKRLMPFVQDQTFMLTWGDGLSNVDLGKLLAFHKSHGKLATMTVVRPPARYGNVVLDKDKIVEFSEKSQLGEGWINGAFFVLEREIFDYIDFDDTQWEKEPLENLAKDEQLMAYHHEGFWQCMDTLRERHILETIWQTGDAPWKTWEDSESSLKGVESGSIIA